MATSALLDYTDANDLVSPVVIYRAVWTPDFDCFNPSETYCYQSFKPNADRLAQAGFQVVEQAPQDCGTCIVKITRSKQESLGLLASAYSALTFGGRLIVYGSKTDGIESILKQIKKHLPAPDVTSKNHGKFITLVKSEQAVGVLDEWCDLLKPSKQEHGYTTANGIFSPLKIDKGSELLAPYCSGLVGQCADFGAGWGWLSTQALKNSPELDSLHLIEAENLALDCAKFNVIDERARFHWLDILSNDLPGPFDNIIMNPPFHQTRKAEPQIGIEFIKAAAKQLTPNGQLLMVANRQLGYEATLNASFGHVEILEQSPIFKIIRARKPNKTSHHRR